MNDIFELAIKTINENACFMKKPLLFVNEKIFNQLNRPIEFMGVRVLIDNSTDGLDLVDASCWKKW